MFDQVRLGYDTVNIARRWLNTEIQDEYKNSKPEVEIHFYGMSPRHDFNASPPLLCIGRTRR